MSQLRCKHPNCHRPLTRANSILCGRHYHQLTDALKEELRFAVQQGQATLDDFRFTLDEYFDERTIGDLEISFCRFCGEDIVWLVSARGRRFSVNAAEVEPGDDQFVSGRHIFHPNVCSQGSKAPT